ncbi:hypothetical protein NC652_015228 [Populus alba x Populus x berolinensis]|nr:hypothetical protein NC652_015228 [Populus alba x Populus x berolinensis]
MVLDFSFYNNHRIKKDDSGIVRNCCWTTYREFWPNKNPAQINHIQGWSLLAGSHSSNPSPQHLSWIKSLRHLLSSLMKAGHQSSLFLLVAQKNHHTKFFQDGTVIDTAVCHHKAMISTCVAHAGMIGNNKAQHIIHVILGFEIGFSADDLQRS